MIVPVLVVVLIAAQAAETQTPAATPRPHPLMERVELGRVLSVDVAGKKLTVKVGDEERTVRLDGIAAHMVETARPGDEVRLHLRDDGTVTAFSWAQSPQTSAQTLAKLPEPEKIEQALVLSVDTLGQKLTVRIGDEEKTVRLEGIAAHTVEMVRPGDKVRLHLRGDGTATAFVIIAWAER